MSYIMFGAIDVGSTDVSLTIYEISEKLGIKKVDYISHIIELGVDSYQFGTIRYELVEELCEVLQEFKGKLQEYKVKDYRAYATSAVREADNGEMILDQIQTKTGLVVQTLSNSEIRLLTYKAIINQKVDFNKTLQKNTAMIDIGSGSVQISLFDKQHMQLTQNLRIGSLRLREMFSHIREKNSVVGKLMEEYVSNEIDTFRTMYMKDKEFKNIIAVGDEIVNIVKCAPELHITNYIDREQMVYICNKLKKYTAEELYLHYGVAREMASLLLYSANLYRMFLQKAKAESIWIPYVTTCDGIAIGYAEKHCNYTLPHDFKEDILAEARNIAKRYKSDLIHIESVESFAMKIFDVTKKIHGLKKKERLLLHLATILHSCGKFINMNDSSENSYHIIMSTEIIGLSHIEREIVANIVYYNKEELPSYKEMQKSISAEEYRVIAKLSAILRISNALDRGHQQKIQQYTVTLKENELLIVADTPMDITLEIGLFKEKCDYFEKVYGIRPVLRQKRRI